MKKLFIILMFLTSCFFLRGQSFYEKGDTLQVWAINGLNLREMPIVNSKKITKISYGEKITVLDEKLGKDTFSTDVCCTIYNEERYCHEIEGFWVKVKWGDSIGFVYDFYLSRLPVMDWIREWRAMQPEGVVKSESFIYYGIRQFGLIEPLENLGPDNFYNKEIEFKNGISYFRKPYFPEKQGREIIRLKGFSLNEGYLLANVLYRIEEVPGKKISATQYEFPFEQVVTKIEEKNGFVEIVHNWN